MIFTANTAVEGAHMSEKSIFSAPWEKMLCTGFLSVDKINKV